MSGAPAAVAGPAPPDSRIVQGLIEKAANFNLWVPGGGAAAGPPTASSATGFRVCRPVHRFDVDMPPPSVAGHGSPIRAGNTVGEEVGRLELRGAFIPDDFWAHPHREPPATRLDPERSQRLVLQEVTFTLGEGHGFRVFGTGRTFPMELGGRPRLTFAAVADVVEGFGRFAGLEGNLVFCGDLDAELGLEAQVMVRLGDPEGRLERVPSPPAPRSAGVTPDGTTFLSWVADKGSEGEHPNFPSTTVEGQIRGFNIPVGLRQVHGDFALAGAHGFQSEWTKGATIGLEIGFGRETAPRTAGSGTRDKPHRFEGVSRYFFYDPAGRTLGTCTANFFEGRSFDLQLPGLGGQAALRFAYYGTFVRGTGAFAGIRGFLYGLGRSLFNPARPGDHVISNLYVARLDDPDGRLRRPGPGEERP